MITDEQAAELLLVDQITPELREILDRAEVIRCINGCVNFVDTDTGEPFMGQETQGCNEPLLPVVPEP